MESNVPLTHTFYEMSFISFTWKIGGADDYYEIRNEIW